MSLKTYQMKIISLFNEISPDVGRAFQRGTITLDSAVGTLMIVVKGLRIDQQRAENRVNELLKERDSWSQIDIKDLIRECVKEAKI